MSDALAHKRRRSALTSLVSGLIMIGCGYFTVTVSELDLAGVLIACGGGAVLRDAVRYFLGQEHEGETE